MNRQKLACLGLVLSIFSVMSSVYAQTPTVYPRLDARIATPLESEASVTETNAGALPLRTLAAPTATWVQSTGPETANPFAFLRRGQRLFQGNFGGLWFSDDNGDNWTRQINNGLLIGRGVTALAASNTTLFLGTNFGGTGGGVYRSTNEGQTWTAINNGFPAPRSIQDFLVNGVNVFAITFNGELFRSTDNGDNWTRINNGLPSAVSVGLGGGFTITNNAILLRNGAENPAAIYRSTDNGANWTKLDLQLPASVLLLNLVANSSKTFLGTTQGLLSSIDGGQSWQSVSGLPTPGSGQGLAPYLSGTTVYVSLVSFSDPNGESTTYISTDNGLTWAQKSKVPFSQIYEILVEGPTVFFGTPNGVVRTNDSGASYEIKNKGLRAAFTWSDVVVLGNRIYVSSHGGGLWLTTDHGATWKQLKNGLPYYAFVSAVRAVGNTLYAALEQPFGFYHSTDFGETWTPLGKGLPSADFTSFPTVLTNNDGKLYLGFDNKGLWVSSDNGENFAQVAGGLPNNAWVWSLAFKDNAIFVATNGTSLFRSTDGGVSFSTSNTGLPALFTRGLLATGNFLFLTTGSGVFRSADNGTTWTPSLTNAFYNTIARSGSAIYVAS
ncbi:MAG: hypothetical protein HOP19_14445, partial [Acidobacteria bacterium]|nr:hypothetical protein [Acidobacteriota bacterium]